MRDRKIKCPGCGKPIAVLHDETPSGVATGGRFIAFHPVIADGFSFQCIYSGIPVAVLVPAKKTARRAG
jgi:hypothetical protein